MGFAALYPSYNSLNQPARFMPDCGLMFAFQIKNMGGKHDKLTDLS